MISPAAADTYSVGPGQAYSRIGEVPWHALKAGDTVYIHHRAEPYREKFQISGRGEATKWIRVLGVPGPNGQLPIISGANATTSAQMRFRWPDASGPNSIQGSGVIHIAPRANDPGGLAPPLPAYIEIANLQIQDGFKDYRFTSENGTVANYEDFSACIYARSVQHLLVRNNVMTNCGLGFFNWTGSGHDVWDGLQVDTVIRGNHFYNNGVSGSFKRHQLYTESDGITIEHNRFGPMRDGSLGSQIKDRSVGTVIRYNHIESSKGWMVDLIEPEESYAALSTRPTYKQTFVYGNVLINRTFSSSIVHWNEDHQLGIGRATLPDGRLFFYNNTVVIVANQTDIWNLSFFNTTYGANDCSPAALPGTVDVRNNVFAVYPRTAGAAIPNIRFAYCDSLNLTFGRNLVTPGWITNTNGTVTGLANLISAAIPASTFRDLARNDVHLADDSPARNAAGALAVEVTANVFGTDMSPVLQYVPHARTVGRPADLDLGAFAHGAHALGALPGKPTNARVTP